MSSTNPKLYGLGTLDFQLETTFGSAATGSMSPLRLVEPIDRSSLTWEAIEHVYVRSGLTTVPPIAGARNGTLTAKVYVHGSSTSDPSGGPTFYTNPVTQFIAQALGNATAGGYTDSETGSTTGTFKATDLSQFTKGQGCVWNTASDGSQMGWMSEIDTGATPDEATMSQTAVSTPTGNKIFGSATAYLTDGLDWNDGGKNSWTLKYTDHESVETTAVGCQVSGLRIEMEPRGLITMEIDFSVAGWSEATGGSPQPYEWNYANPQAWTSARIAYGASAGSTIRVSSMSFDAGLELVENVNPNASEGIGSFSVVQRQPTLEFSVFRQLDQWPARFENPDAVAKFSMVAGTSASQMFGIYFGQAHVLEFPSAEDQEGRIGTTVKLAAGENYSDVGGGGETGLQNTDCRISIT